MTSVTAEDIERLINTLVSRDPTLTVQDRAKAIMALCELQAWRASEVGNSPVLRDNIVEGAVWRAVAVYDGASKPPKGGVV